MLCKSSALIINEQGEAFVALNELQMNNVGIEVNNN